MRRCVPAATLSSRRSARSSAPALATSHLPPARRTSPSPSAWRSSSASCGGIARQSTREAAHAEKWCFHRGRALARVAGDQGGRRGRCMDVKTAYQGHSRFPEAGNPVLRHFYAAGACRGLAGDRTASRCGLGPYQPELLVGIESRGFLVAAPLAYSLGCGFAMVRKKGKLPGRHHPLYLRSRIRHRHHRDPGRCHPAGTAGDRARRSPRHRRHARRPPSASAAWWAAMCWRPPASSSSSFLDGRKRLDVPFASVVEYQLNSTGGAGPAPTP